MTNVFVVIAGWNWDGPDVESVRVFATREAAEAYAEELAAARSWAGYTQYDYADVTEQEVKLRLVK